MKRLQLNSPTNLNNKLQKETDCYVLDLQSNELFRSCANVRLCLK